MTTTETAPALFDIPARFHRACPPVTHQTADPCDDQPDTTEQTPLDPSRWVMTGWRNAQHVTLTREQILAVFHATKGPCARCGTPHHRYGEGGQPLCPACRTPPGPL